MGVISGAPRGDIRLSHMYIEHTHSSEDPEQPRTILINKRWPAGQSNHRTKHSPPGSHTRPATIAECPAGVPRRHPERINVHVVSHNTIRMSQWSHTEAVTRTECSETRNQSTTDLPSSVPPSRGFSRTECSKRL